MSSCLTGGGRAYRLDLEIIKSPSSSWTSNSSSPSSTLSETSNSPLAISTRKPRTPRKRPNQTYNEAAALLSTAYPKIFSTKHLTKPCKFTKQQQYPFSYESSDLLLPFRSIDDSCFLIHHRPPPMLEKSSHQSRQKQVSSLCEKPCQSPGEISSKGNNNNNNNNSSLENFDDSQEDFDAESILDEEIEEGIDSILGEINVKKEYSVAEPNNNNNNGFCCSSISSSNQLGTCYGYPVGLGFGVNYFEEYGYGLRRNSISAFRKVDDGEWWRYPSVNIGDITPKFNKPVSEKKKKKKKVEEKNSSVPAASSSRTNKENSEQKSPPQAAAGAGGGGGMNEESVQKSNFSALLLKLDYEEILNAWSDRSCPFSEDSPVSDATGNDVHVRTQIP